MEVHHRYVSGELNDPDDAAPLGPEEWDEPHDVTPGSVTVEDLEPGILDGIAGPPGPVGMTWRGPWSASTPYEPRDVVSHGGSSYICTAAQTDIEPPDTLCWETIADRGATWWSGDGPATLVVGSKAGDYYLDRSTGIVYQLT